MRAIADAVGIRGSSLYHHFPSKLDLLFAIAIESTKDFIDAQLPRVVGVTDQADTLRDLLYAHVIYFHEHRLEEAVGLRELQELRDNAPEHYAELQTIRRSYQEALERLISDGVREGAFDCDDAHLATLAVLGLVNSVNDWFRPDRTHTIEQVARAYADLSVDRILGAESAQAAKRSVSLSRT
jgi:AcrR family transcriptional regulator